MTPSEFIEEAARAGVEVSRTPTGTVKLSGPKHLLLIFMIQAKAIKSELIDYLPRLPHPAPVDRGSKNACKSTPAPPAPPAPPKNGAGETAPPAPKNQTELKGSSFQVDRSEKGHSVYEYRLTDKPDTWRIMLADCTLDQARHALAVKFGPDRLLAVRLATLKITGATGAGGAVIDLQRKKPAPPMKAPPGQAGQDRGSGPVVKHPNEPKEQAA